MSIKYLKKIIEIDGHVGLEKKLDIVKRFKKFFKFVKGEIRYDKINSAMEYIKQYDLYGREEIDIKVLNYLKTLDEEEMKIFDLASGIAQINIENNNISSSSDASGFLLLKASDNEIKHCKLKIEEKSNQNNFFSILENNDIFIKGWWNIESNDQKKFRWSKKKSYCFINGCSGKNFNFDIFSNYPKIKEKPIEVFFINNKDKKLIYSILLTDNESKKINIRICEDSFQLQIFCDLTWIPNLLIDSSDSRELGIGIFNVSIR